jgi:hypothetical protein
MNILFPPVPSTCVSDTQATHRVDSISNICAGVYGYYTNEFDAYRVAKFLRDNGHTQVRVLKRSHEQSTTLYSHLGVYQ